jgi:hypothetical protein
MRIDELGFPVWRRLRYAFEQPRHVPRDAVLVRAKIAAHLEIFTTIIQETLVPWRKVVHPRNLACRNMVSERSMW